MTLAKVPIQITDSMVIMEISEKTANKRSKRPLKDCSKLTTTALVGGMLCASLAGLVAIKRYLDIRDLKKELNNIPWDTKEVTWKHFFRKY